MREPKIYLTKKVKRNLELKERIKKYGSKSVKYLPKETRKEKALARRNQRLKRKEEARRLKAAKKEARSLKRAERKAQKKGV